MKVSTFFMVTGGLITLIGATAVTMNHFETREGAQYVHNMLSETSEKGRLEAERGLVSLEISWLLKMQRSRELDAEEQDRLQFLREKRANIDSRLRIIQSSRG